MNAVQLCNMALSSLGIPTIVSFDDDSNQARQCKIFFPVLRDRVLRDHIWSFALAGAELQELSETPYDPTFSTVCALPVDLIRLVDVYPEQEYRLNGRKLLTHSAIVHIVYVRRVENPELFDPLFCDALQSLMASEIALSNTRDASLAQYHRQEYERRLLLAQSVDSQENIHIIQPGQFHSNFIAAKFGRSIRGNEQKITARTGDCGVQ